MKKPVSNSIQPNITSNKTESKPKRPYWTQSRIAKQLKVTAPHLHYVLSGKRRSSSLVNCCIATVGFDRFAELAAPEVVKAYVSKSY